MTVVKLGICPLKDAVKKFGEETAIVDFVMIGRIDGSVREALGMKLATCAEVE